MITNVLYVTVYVRDQDEALEFYVGKLGLQVRADYSGPEGRFLTVGVVDSTVEIVLWAAEPMRPAIAADTSPGVVPGPIILETADLAAAYAELSANGVTFEEAAPVEYPFGVRATAIDGDGNRISLRQRRA